MTSSRSSFAHALPEVVGEGSVEAGEQRALSLAGEALGLLQGEQGLAGARAAGDADARVAAEVVEDAVLLLGELDDGALVLGEGGAEGAAEGERGGEELDEDREAVVADGSARLRVPVGEDAADILGSRWAMSANVTTRSDGVLPLKLADGVVTRLADGHHADARPHSGVRMAISRASASAAW